MNATHTARIPRRWTSPAALARMAGALLLLLTCGLVAWKVYRLGFHFPVRPEQRPWRIDGILQFHGDGQPVHLEVDTPPTGGPWSASALDENTATGRAPISEGGSRAWHWKNLKDRRTVHIDWWVAPENPIQRAPAPEPVALTREEQTRFEKWQATRPPPTTTRLDMAEQLEAQLRREKPETQALRLAARMLSHAGIPARPVFGAPLRAPIVDNPTENRLEVFENGYWRPVGRKGPWVALGRLDQPWLSLANQPFGLLTVSVNPQWHPLPEGDRTLKLAAPLLAAPPLVAQQAGRLLLLPIGVLLIACFRVFIGSRTIGIFIPALLGLAFLETGLKEGLVCWVGVVGAGFGVRWLMSRFHLLYVPRAAILTSLVVLLLIVVVAVAPILGMHFSSRALFFPIIIVAWTIETLVMTTEGESLWDALKDALLLAAVSIGCFAVMSIPALAPTLTVYPELLLAQCGLLLWIGTYGGFRLTELWRFRPLAPGPAVVAAADPQPPAKDNEPA